MRQMKAIFIATLLALCNFVYAQQNTEFKEIKDYFDSQKSLLKTEFQKKLGFLAQLVQSIWFTPRGSGVRIPQDPQNRKSHRNVRFFFVYK